jgi:hypothetical protein
VLAFSNDENNLEEFSASKRRDISSMLSRKKGD